MPHTNEELMQKYLDGGDEAEIFDALYRQNIGLIVTLANETAASFNCLHYAEWKGEMQTTGYTQAFLEDLQNEGAMAMFQKIRDRDYDPNRAKFSTYIYTYIKGAMYRYMETNIGNISLTKDQSEAIRKAQMMYAQGCDVAEISEAIGQSREATGGMISYNTHALAYYDFVPLELLNDEEADYDPFEFVPMDGDPTLPPDRVFYKKIRIELLHPLFLSLSERDQYILGSYYGVYGKKKLPLDEMALTLMMTVDGVTKAIKTSIRNARKAYKESELKIWLDAFAAVKRAQK